MNKEIAAIEQEHLRPFIGNYVAGNPMFPENLEMCKALVSLVHEAAVGNGKPQIGSTPDLGYPTWDVARQIVDKHGIVPYMRESLYPFLLKYSPPRMDTQSADADFEKLMAAIEPQAQVLDSVASHIASQKDAALQDADKRNLWVNADGVKLGTRQGNRLRFSL